MTTKLGGSAEPVWIENDAVTVKTGAAAFQVSLLGGASIIPVSRYIRKYAFANVAASQTDSSIVAAVVGKRIRVLGLAMVTGATATNVTFNTKPAGAGTAITCLFANGMNGGAVLPETATDDGWFQTGPGDGLTATTGAGSTTGIHVVYCEV